MASKRNKRADAVRSAVDDAFTAAADQAQVTRGRAQELVEELAGAAGRMRDVLDDLRPPTGDEIRDLRKEIAALRERVAKLERGPAKRSAAAKPAAKKPAAPKKPATPKKP